MAKARHGNDIRILKEANRYLVLQCIMKLAPVSTDDIIQSTGLSRPTVLNILHDLMEEDVVVKDGFSAGTIGRSASLLNLNAQRPVALGIDFEYPAIPMCIANLRGEILHQRKILCDSGLPFPDVKEFFYRSAVDFMKSSSIPTEAFCGAGIGICGTIRSKDGTSMSIERIRDWYNVPIRADLEKLLGIPVFLRNDVHLLGLVEKRLYLPDDMQNFIYIGIRTGIGSVTYQNGKPLRGIHGNAGFIGHTVVNAFGPRCCCGSRGCLETYAGQQAIANQYQALTRVSVSFDEVIERANAGDANAIMVLQDAGQIFGVSVSNLAKTLEISDVIVGSPSIHKDSPFMVSATHAVEEYSGNLGLNIHLHIGRVVEEQYPLGGCYLVFEHLFSKPKLALSLV